MNRTIINCPTCGHFLGVTIKCLNCGKEFTSISKKVKKFCNTRCQWTYNSKKQQLKNPDEYRKKQKEVMRKRYEERKKEREENNEKKKSILQKFLSEKRMKQI